MCGICGVIGEPAAAAELQVRRMLTRLERRGPDSGGTFSGDGVFLGATRLSIISPSDGHQPLRDERSGLVLVANAEIYNYVELREQLLARGHSFSTGGDCEVILKLYKEKGADLVHDLRGVFAFALFDKRRGKLLLARDRLGEKPLYVNREGRRLRFASEIGALVCSGKVPVHPDLAALKEFFAYQYVPEPSTLLKDVRQIEAGHLVEIEIATGKTSTRRYWSMSNAPADLRDPAKVLRQELVSISKIITRADVPIGVALSGGLDSGTVAALVAAHQPSTKAICIGYAGYPAVDERKRARRVAEDLNLPLIEAELSADDVTANFDGMMDAVDLPAADMAGFGYYAIARLARDAGIKVLAFGHGGDELFWGYRWLSAALAALSEENPAEINREHLFYHNEAVGIFRRISPRLFNPDFLEASAENVPKRPEEPVSLQVRVTQLMIENYLRTNGVAQTERLCMAHGVEARLPFLDYRFVEWTIRLRKASGDAHLPEKSWLRAAVAGLVPDGVADQAKKPFLTPTRLWHRHLFGTFADRVARGWLHNSGIVTSTGAERLASGACGVQHGTSLSYKALVFETWFDQVRHLRSSF